MAVAAFLANWDPAVTAAVVAAVVSVITLILGAPLRMWVEQHLQRNRLRSEYEYQQRKELRTLIGRHHGRLVQAAESFHQRLGNLYRYENERWLNDRESFYSKTTQYRFLRVCSLARAFEREAYFIDARIAEPQDFDFLKFTKAFLWATTSLALFRGLDYEVAVSKDHFFADQIRQICDHFSTSADTILSYEEFDQCLRESATFDEVCKFFCGLHSSEERLRWDRLVVFDLLLMGFLGAVGYKTQQPTPSELSKVAQKIRHPVVRQNFIRRLPKLGLAEEPQMRMVAAALVSAGLPRG